MTIYIALLPGINVDGHKLIKMQELKKVRDGDVYLTQSQNPGLS
ncbi:DUF1697 domain-containing protein [Priestia aryabhattai]